MRSESTFEGEDKKVSPYWSIVFWVIGIAFSILAMMTYNHLGGIRVIVTAGISIEQIGSLIFFVFMGIVGLYFSFKKFRYLGILRQFQKVINILTVVLILLVSIFFVKNRYFEVSDKVIDLSDNVKIVLEEDTISKEGLEMSIINTMSHKIYYTKAYSLEVYRFGKWFKVPSTKYQTTVAMLWQIPIEIQESVQYKWIGKYGKLGNGRYRILVKIYQDSTCVDEENAFYVASEFIIE